jgi:hypothetical protein
MTIMQTIASGLYEEPIVIDLCTNIVGIQPVYPAGMGTDELGDCYVDVCTNLIGLQKIVPEGFEDTDEDIVCDAIPLEDRVISITEIYANAPGSDDGLEFIELYNPNPDAVNIRDYRLQIGPNFTTEFMFADELIQSGEYKAFTDADTGITLPNSTGVVIRLIAPNGNMVSATEAYNDAQDDESWSIIDTKWTATNQITPDLANKPFLAASVGGADDNEEALEACPAGKFRNPDTNRCKTIESTSGLTACRSDQFRNPQTNRCNNLASTARSLTPCRANQFRNPDTNRCNNSSSASSSLTPCKPGQTRNPETNRCRTTGSEASDLKPCNEGQERNPETNRCRNAAVLGSSDSSTLASSVTDIAAQSTPGAVNWPIIVGALTATIGYMLYEWRRELTLKFQMLRRA